MKQIKTRLCDLLRLNTPLFQAPMAGAVTPQLASSVANYGGVDRAHNPRINGAGR